MKRQRINLADVQHEAFKLVAHYISLEIEGGKSYDGRLLITMTMV